MRQPVIQKPLYGKAPALPYSTIHYKPQSIATSR